MKITAYAANVAIKPMVETFTVNEVDRALDHVRQGKARFRAVLVA